MTPAIAVASTRSTGIPPENHWIDSQTEQKVNSSSLLPLIAMLRRRRPQQI